MAAVYLEHHDVFPNFRHLFSRAKMPPDIFYKRGAEGATRWSKLADWLCISCFHLVCIISFNLIFDIRYYLFAVNKYLMLNIRLKVIMHMQLTRGSGTLANEAGTRKWGWPKNYIWGIMTPHWQCCCSRVLFDWEVDLSQNNAESWSSSTHFSLGGSTGGQHIFSCVDWQLG